MARVSRSSHGQSVEAATTGHFPYFSGLFAPRFDFDFSICMLRCLDATANLTMLISRGGGGMFSFLQKPTKLSVLLGNVVVARDLLEAGKIRGRMNIYLFWPIFFRQNLFLWQNINRGFVVSRLISPRCGNFTLPKYPDTGTPILPTSTFLAKVAVFAS